MPQVLRDDLPSLVGAGQNHRALEYGEHVLGDAPRIERRIGRVARLRLGHQTRENFGHAGESPGAARAQGLIGGRQLLRENAGDAAGWTGLAQLDGEIDETESAFQGVRLLQVAARTEGVFAIFHPALERGLAQGMFAVEVMKQRALGDPGLGADVVDPGRGVAAA